MPADVGWECICCSSLSSLSRDTAEGGLAMDEQPQQQGWGGDVRYVTDDERCEDREDRR
jgi:hypothetical protein